MRNKGYVEQAIYVRLELTPTELRAIADMIEEAEKTAVAGQNRTVKTIYMDSGEVRFLMKAGIT